MGPTGEDPPLGAYLHVPFCFHKCHYCDFYSVVDRLDRQGPFVDRLVDEIRGAAPYLVGPLQTVFIGGGTPTLLAPSLWPKLLGAMKDHWLLDSDAEFTVEANPETITAELASVLAAGGVNRVSIGAQSFDPRHLQMLERHHEPANVERGVRILREAGLANLNLDLIFGIPGQTPIDWQADLDLAIGLEPEHLSCYGLTYEPNTPLTVRLRQGAVTRVDEAAEASMYETTLARLDAAGYEHYEISNFCRPGRECRHNLVYWRNQSWWPLGPGAAGHVAGVRWKNVPRLAEYLATSDPAGLPPIRDVERLDADGRVGEALMLGLRLRGGIDESRLDALLGEGERGPGRRAAITRHVDAGLLAQSAGALRLTGRGLLLADTVLADLI
ncbi:MAG: radical SAM family heme chaperone HemW [Planctomycetota bacterium]